MFLPNCTTTASNGQIGADLSAFHAAGYTKEKLVDLIVVIGIITVTNLLHNVTEVPIDFPTAVELINNLS
jgi:alkylhydroperoxidase family enzyme